MVDHQLPAPAKIRRRRYHVFLQVSDHMEIICSFIFAGRRASAANPVAGAGI